MGNPYYPDETSMHDYQRWGVYEGYDDFEDEGVGDDFDDPDYEHDRAFDREWDYADYQ